MLIFIDKRRVFGEYDRMTAELYKVSTDGGSKKISDEEFEKESKLSEASGIATDEEVKAAFNLWLNLK